MAQRRGSASGAAGAARRASGSCLRRLQASAPLRGEPPRRRHGQPGRSEPRRPPAPLPPLERSRRPLGGGGRFGFCFGVFFAAVWISLFLFFSPPFPLLGDLFRFFSGWDRILWARGGCAVAPGSRFPLLSPHLSSQTLMDAGQEGARLVLGGGEGRRLARREGVGDGLPGLRKHGEKAGAYSQGGRPSSPPYSEGAITWLPASEPGGGSGAVSAPTKKGSSPPSRPPGLTPSTRGSGGAAGRPVPYLVENKDNT